MMVFTSHFNVIGSYSFAIATKLYMAGLLGCRDQDPKTIPWLKQGPIYLMSGLTAEMVSGIIWTPMDVAKSRLQRGKDHHTKARTLLKEIWKTEGYRGVWRVRMPT
jgi:hypothetical protein